MTEMTPIIAQRPGEGGAIPVARRALLAAAVLAPLDGLAAVTARAAPGTAQLAEWRAAVQAVADAKLAMDRYQRDVMDPINARFPVRPEATIRVGTHHRTGEPLMHTFWPQDFEEANAYQDTAGFKQAAPAWRAYNKARASLLAETDYDAKEATYDALVCAHADAIHDCLITPAPDAPSFGEKLLIAFDDDDGPDLDENWPVRSAIVADVRRLIGAGWRP